MDRSVRLAFSLGSLQVLCCDRPRRIRQRPRMPSASAAATPGRSKDSPAGDRYCSIPVVGGLSVAVAGSVSVAVAGGLRIVEVAGLLQSGRRDRGRGGRSRLGGGEGRRRGGRGRGIGRAV